MKYGIEVGQIYVSACGSMCGHIVTDVTTYAHCDDVVTTHFASYGVVRVGGRIDAFKLAVVRYALADALPDWAPQELKMLIEQHGIK